MLKLNNAIIINKKGDKKSQNEIISKYPEIFNAKNRDQLIKNLIENDFIVIVKEPGEFEVWDGSNWKTIKYSAFIVPPFDFDNKSDLEKLINNFNKKHNEFESGETLIIAYVNLVGDDDAEILIDETGTENQLVVKIN